MLSEDHVVIIFEIYAEVKIAWITDFFNWLIIVYISMTW